MNALWTLGKLASKPSDKKIRTTRIIFALLLITIITLGLNATDVNISIFDHIFYDLPDYLVYILFVFPAIGLVRGILDPGLFRKAIWKKVITSAGILMMVFSIFFLSEKEIQPTNNTELSATSENQTQNNFNFDFAITDSFIAFFGFITIFVGLFLNNKNLTTRNEKFGEKINKIRV